MALYRMWNGASPTTAVLTAVSTGTALKTMLQFKASGTVVGKVKSWGFSFDGSAAAAGIQVELIETDVAATVTAFVAADVNKIDSDALSGGDPTTNLIQVGTSASGYGLASAEGSITATRLFDGGFFQPTGNFSYTWPDMREPVVQVAKFLRIRMKAAAAVNMLCYVDILV